MSLTMQQMKEKIQQDQQRRERIKCAVELLMARGQEGVYSQYLREHLSWEEIKEMLKNGMIERCWNSSYRLTRKALYKDA